MAILKNFIDDQHWLEKRIVIILVLPLIFLQDEVMMTLKVDSGPVDYQLVNSVTVEIE